MLARPPLDYVGNYSVFDSFSRPRCQSGCCQDSLFAAAAPRPHTPLGSRFPGKPCLNSSCCSCLSRQWVSLTSPRWQRRLSRCRAWGWALPRHPRDRRSEWRRSRWASWPAAHSLVWNARRRGAATHRWRLAAGCAPELWEKGMSDTRRTKTLFWCLRSETLVQHLHKALWPAAWPLRPRASQAPPSALGWPDPTGGNFLLSNDRHVTLDWKHSPLRKRQKVQWTDFVQEKTKETERFSVTSKCPKPWNEINCFIKESVSIKKKTKEKQFKQELFLHYAWCYVIVSYFNSRGAKTMNFLFFGFM